uniref:Uncharacterized protein n=1 Tax=Arundo donax TaxID=35708 RepID=A0A0A9CM94_ARUDO
MDAEELAPATVCRRRCFHKLPRIALQLAAPFPGSLPRQDAPTPSALSHGLPWSPHLTILPLRPSSYPVTRATRFLGPR